MHSPSATAPVTLLPPADHRPIHPVWIRVTHWINALAVLMLVTSGWRSVVLQFRLHALWVGSQAKRFGHAVGNRCE